jgi:hypothetical protein
MSSLSTSSRLDSNSGVTAEKPVIFPPARATLATMPVLTASPTDPMTIGVVAVADLAASAAGVPEVTIRSTGSEANSTAIAG